VTDFAVAHLAIGKADIFATGADSAAWISAVEMIVERSLGQQGRIAIGRRLRFATWVDAPAVTDNQNYRLFHEIRFMLHDRRAVKEGVDQTPIFPVSDPSCHCAQCISCIGILKMGDSDG